VSANRAARPVLDAPRAALPPAADLAERLSASPLLVALDIDGTLAPIAPTPAEAAVPERTRRVLEHLTELQNVHLAFVTGRAARDGHRLVHVANSWTIGNHGIELIDPAGALRVDDDAEKFAPAVAEAVAMLHEPLSRYEGVFIENKQWTASIHFRLADPATTPNVQRIVTDVAGQLGLRVLEGKKIFELRPPVAINKGTALLQLSAALGVFVGNEMAGSLLYVGDDRTDEDAFRALPPAASNAATVHVGPAELPDGQRTSAELLLDDTEGVRVLLEWLVKLRRPA
jgi:trehalose-phosphatase